MEFSSSTPHECPTGWICTGGAKVESGSNGLRYFALGTNYGVGTAYSSSFTLPATIDHVALGRAGGANGPTSGFFVKRVSDGLELCSATLGTNTQTFTEDLCPGLSAHAGEEVYMYAVDDQASYSNSRVTILWIQLRDVNNAVLSIRGPVGRACGVPSADQAT